MLDRVPVDKMPDLPLLIGPGANGQARQLDRLLAAAPTLKPQLASATWVGGRRWDLELPVRRDRSRLPEGEAAAARRRLPSSPSSTNRPGLLGRGIVRFDLRVPGKMIVRLPRAPGEPIAPAAATEQG